LASFEKQNDVISEKDLLFRAFFVFVGFGLAVSGGTTLILYLNLLPIGFSFFEYFNYIVHRFECYFFPMGIFIVWVSIYFPSEGATKHTKR
jgi:hypothetical protein